MEGMDTITSTIKEIAQTALISFGIFLFVYIFLVQPHRVQGISMQPSFENGELLLTEKVTYRISGPEQGDVVVFKAPVGRRADFIKRIIGLPQDRIKIDGGDVFINGEKIKENYIASKTDGAIEITLADDEYFVMGDNRSSSSDSRSFGPIKKESIKGKVLFVYWPIVKSVNFKGVRLISAI